ncbi:MAG TPA: TIGR01777 family oxidoreductase [Phycisphaerales bacterium]|nr:TIGR01777 family oxidoreductase [Phycisphaerales bacterium]HMP37669.1 TIGR01777 family oxidoreductase [Phycisphaerales bacterium]
MHLVITGATGTIGRRLVLDRLGRGDAVTVISRDAGSAARLFAAASNPRIRVVEGDCGIPGAWQRSLDGADAVVHLAAAGIADRRWTAEYRRTIEESRLDGTHQVVVAIEESRRPPAVFLSASATGYYGDGGDRELGEDAPAGTDFLAELCVRWEAEAMKAASAATRCVAMRIGIVLDDRGGALPRLLPFFRRGLGGRMASGRQWMPWVHWQDVIGMIDLALRDGRVRGALNVVAPTGATNREFTRELARAVGRRAPIPVPYLGLRLAFGGIARFLVSSQRAVPALAARLGHRFAFPELEAALAEAVARSFGGARSEAVALRGSGLAPARGAAASGAAGRPAALAAAVDLQRSHSSSPSPSPPSASASPHQSLRGTVRSAAALRPAPPGPAAAVRLLAIDVDGTLLRSDGELTAPVRRAVRRAVDAGVVVVLATARSPRLMHEVVRALDLVGPTINFNGAVIWNPLDHRAQHHESLPPDLAQSVVGSIRGVDPDVVVEIDVLDRCHTDRVDRRLQQEVARLLEPTTVGPLELVLRAPVTRINVLAPAERLPRALEPVREGLWRQRRVAMFLSHPHMAQVTAPLVDKGIALQRVARRINVRREEIMAIGDAANDMGMLEWAGFGVAMENASSAVRSVADATAPSCDENGVAWAIERWVMPAPAAVRPSAGSAVAPAPLDGTRAG